MHQRATRKLHLTSQTLRQLAGAELREARGGEGGEPGISGERCSIVYWCSDNTSIQRSCSGCTGSGTA